jgi:hypothetical protein
MTETATKTAQKKEEKTALVKIATPEAFEKLLDSIPKFRQIETMTRPQIVDQAGKDFYNDFQGGMQFVAAALKGTMCFAKVMLASAPYVNKWRDLFKINVKLPADDPKRVTFRSAGIVVPPGLTIRTNDKDVEIKEDDAIGWTNFCMVAWRKTPQEVNRSLNPDGVRKALPAYQEEAGPRRPTSHGIQPTGPASTQGRPQPGDVKDYRVHVTAEYEEEEEEEEETENPSPVANAKPIAPEPTGVTLELPHFKPGDVDTLFSFLSADDLVGAQGPLDAVFGELETDFDLAKKAEQLARRIVEQFCTSKSVIKVTVTCEKKKGMLEDEDDPDPDGGGNGGDVITASDEKAMEEHQAALDATDRKKELAKQKRRHTRSKNKRKEQQQAIQQIEDYSEAIKLGGDAVAKPDEKPEVPFTPADEVL